MLNFEIILKRQHLFTYYNLYVGQFITTIAQYHQYRVMVRGAKGAIALESNILKIKRNNNFVVS